MGRIAPRGICDIGTIEELNEVEVGKTMFGDLLKAQETNFLVALRERITLPVI